MYVLKILSMLLQFITGFMECYLWYNIMVKSGMGPCNLWLMQTFDKYYFINESVYSENHLFKILANTELVTHSTRAPGIHLSQVR
jgi:hypothetical protein